MSQGGPMNDRDSAPRWIGWAVVAVASLLAALSVRPYAGGWNDSSRLATVEALVDHGTLAIDRSIFVQVPAVQHPSDPRPYPPEETALLQFGTGDKLWIDGHFYSDKSPVPALAMAAMYALWSGVTGETAAASPDDFCYVLGLLSSGLAYVLAVWCVFQLGAVHHLNGSLRLLVTASFALATMAPVYIRQVNNHIVQLAVCAGLMLQMARFREEALAGRVGWGRFVAIGMLAGAGYTVDLGVGPVLVACTFALVWYRCRNFRGLCWFVAA